jgi:hypothetical protein
MPVVHGGFEWAHAKAKSNLGTHGVAFEDAVPAINSPLSLELEDLVLPANLIPLAANATNAYAISARDARFGRRPGHGHHVERSAGEIVAIDADLDAHFGSAEAVNDALRQVVASKKATGS